MVIALTIKVVVAVVKTIVLLVILKIVLPKCLSSSDTNTYYSFNNNTS